MDKRKGLIGVFILAVCFSLASCSIKEDAENVVQEITTDKPSGEIIVLKDEFNPGEEIRLAYTLDSDTLTGGTIKLLGTETGAAGRNETGNNGNRNENGDKDNTNEPVNNEANDTSREEKAFNKNIGVLTFTAPTEPGTYELAMYTKDLDGNSTDGMDEISSITIKVIDPDVETRSLDADMEISKESYSPGETITVNYTAPSAWDNTAWIGIVPSIVDHGNERENFKNKLEHKNLSGPKGTLTFTAPQTPGVYDLRMHNSDKDGMEVEDIRIIVK